MPDLSSSFYVSSEPTTLYGRRGLSIREADQLLDRWGQWTRQERILGYDTINIIWWISRRKGDGLDSTQPEYDDQTMMQVDRQIAGMPPKEKNIVKYWYAFRWSYLRIMPRFRVSKSTVYRIIDKARINVKNAL